MSDREEGSISGSDRERSPLSPGERERSPTPASNRGSDSANRRRSRSRSGSRRSRGSPGPRSVSRSRSRSRSRSFRRSHRSRSRSGSRHRRRRSSGRYDRRRGRSRSRSPMSRRRRHQGSRENPKSSRCLGVFGLSLYTEERDLRDHFTRYGAVEEVQIVYDHQTGRSRGFAFIYMRSHEDAEEAKERAPGTEINGRNIRVDYSITKRAHTPTPGIYLGKPTSSGGYYDRRDDRDRGGYSGGRRSPSPYGYGGRRGGRYSRSRSRSYSPHRSPRRYNNYY